MMNGKILPAIAVCVSMIGGGAEAKSTNSDPLDFDYRVAGDQKIRPTLVFNDGVDTYVQTNIDAEGDVSIKGVEFEKQGPYLVIRGVVQKFTVFSKKSGVATVAYIGSAGKGGISGPAVVDAHKHEVARSLQAQGDATVSQSKAVIQASETAPSVKQSVQDSKPNVRVAAEHEAKGRLEALHTEASQEVCRRTIQTKESAFVVAFGGKSAGLSAAAVESLRSAIGSTSDIQSIRGHTEAMNDDEKVSAARAKTIVDTLKKFGVAGEKISIGTRSATGIGTELRIVHGKMVDCEVAPGTINVVAHDRQNVSIAADADAADVLAKLATSAGLPYRKEGAAKKIPLKVAQQNQPLLLVLEAIGNSLGNAADIIYRDNEIVLRYLNQQ